MNPEAQLKKLERVLELLDDSGYVKTEEFVQLFETLLKVLRGQLTETAKYIRENTDESGTRLSNTESMCKDMEKKLDMFKKELTKRVEEIELIPGDPGADADEEAIFQRLAALIPEYEECRDKSPEELVSTINSSSVLIKKSTIEGWEDLERIIKHNVESSVRKPKDFDVRIGVSKTDLDRLQAQITEIANSTTTGATWIREDVTGTINGTNDTFTLSQAPSSPDSLILSLSRQIQIQGVDFTLSGSTITYTTPPNAAFASEPHIAQFQ